MIMFLWFSREQNHYSFLLIFRSLEKKFSSLILWRKAQLCGFKRLMKGFQHYFINFLKLMFMHLKSLPLYLEARFLQSYRVSSPLPLCLSKRLNKDNNFSAFFNIKAFNFQITKQFYKVLLNYILTGRQTDCFDFSKTQTSVL